MFELHLSLLLDDEGHASRSRGQSVEDSSKTAYSGAPLQSADFAPESEDKVEGQLTGVQVIP